MIELLGGLFGGLFRLAPEVLKFVDRKDERKHEVLLLSHQIEADKLRMQQQLDLGQQQITIQEIAGIVEGVKVQGERSGIPLIDGINSLMRPILTFWWCIVLYTAAIVAQYVAIVQAGTAYLPAIVEIFGPTEKAIAMSIISFWFVDRALRYINGSK